MDKTKIDKVIIKDLLVRGVIGINDWERKIMQDMLINITLGFDISRAGETDNIDDTINYRSISKRVIEYVETSKHYLVEKLATEIAKICLVEFNAESALIKVEKPKAVRFAESVGVEIFREKSYFKN